MDDLKPCPFCGALPEINYAHNQNVSTAYVRCYSCGAHTRNCNAANDKDAAKQAKSAWNMRMRGLWDL